ncbi:hypothetical protein [Bradyrhizobium sp. CB3481]|uniref:hypothetical protein n=1 Tax=Bradyrhizobium sp. CB3481 TaxID=3039158 RepID=UPI0024B04700|nr:hypothetical protein [Bradyrhizobium sp. CB3481]WFU18743.1 hypothetical protein QA643_10620 [Bradyrhizobium sp. CB3481]
MKFALELVLPERLTHPGGSPASDPKPEASQNAAAGPAEHTEQTGKARRLIEELDHGKFGGPSFGPQTIELMSRALEDAEASLPEGASDHQLRLLAATVLKVAGDGERDPIRLKAAAMSALEMVADTDDDKPPSA